MSHRSSHARRGRPQLPKYAGVVDRQALMFVAVFSVMSICCVLILYKYGPTLVRYLEDLSTPPPPAHQNARQ